MPVLQAPVQRENAARIGPTTARATVLRAGKVPYYGRVIDFSRNMLATLVENFRKGAYDAVPVVLVDEKNLHNMDVERRRGVVTGLELSGGDKLVATVALNEDGAKLVRDHPDLGRSVRIVEEPHPGGAEQPRHVPAVQHVALTLDPHIGGMGDWEIDGGVFASAYPSDQVIDLSAFRYADDMPDITLSPEQITELRGLEGEAFDQKLTELTASATPTPPASDTDANEGGKGLFERLKAAFSKSDNAEIERELAGLVDEHGTGGLTPEPASLSAEAQEAIDLAKREASEAKRAASEARKEAREETFLRVKAELVGKGVPPEEVDLAKPALTGEASVIDLSGGEKWDPAEFAREMLSRREGTISLSGPIGVVGGEENAEREATLKAWEEQSG